MLQNSHKIKVSLKKVISISKNDLFYFQESPIPYQKEHVSEPLIEPLNEVSNGSGHEADDEEEDESKDQVRKIRNAIDELAAIDESKETESLKEINEAKGLSQKESKANSQSIKSEDNYSFSYDSSSADSTASQERQDQSDSDEFTPKRGNGEPKRTNFESNVDPICCRIITDDNRCVEYHHKPRERKNVSKKRNNDTKNEFVLSDESKKKKTKTSLSKILPQNEEKTPEITLKVGKNEPPTQENIEKLTGSPKNESPSSGNVSHTLKSYLENQEKLTNLPNNDLDCLEIITTIPNSVDFSNTGLPTIRNTLNLIQTVLPAEQNPATPSNNSAPFEKSVPKLDPFVDLSNLPKQNQVILDFQSSIDIIGSDGSSAGQKLRLGVLDQGETDRISSKEALRDLAKEVS